MLREHLLDGPASAAAFTPLWGAEPTLQAAAERAHAAVAWLMPFDVVLLGMGDDGHFASLFPGSPVLAEGLDPDGERHCVAVPAGSPAPPQPRISLTLHALLNSHQVLLLITGEAKRRRIEEALAGADLPVRALLLQERTPVRILWAP
jgi:6-phosphogluconolactonase